MKANHSFYYYNCQVYSKKKTSQNSMHMRIDNKIDMLYLTLYVHECGNISGML